VEERPIPGVSARLKHILEGRGIARGKNLEITSVPQKGWRVDLTLALEE